VFGIAGNEGGTGCFRDVVEFSIGFVWQGNVTGGNDEGVTIGGDGGE
jgi:hypothetical protein